MTSLARIDTEVLIGASPEKVWAMLTDPAGYAGWNPYITRLAGALEAGSELGVTLVHVPGKPETNAIVTVVRADFPEMRWEGGHSDRAILKGDHVFRCEPAAGGCRFHHFETFSGVSAERLLVDYGARIEANFGIFNQALKRAAEA